MVVEFSSPVDLRCSLRTAKLKVLEWGAIEDETFYGCSSYSRYGRYGRYTRYSMCVRVDASTRE